MNHLYFVRHGLSVMNQQGTYSGRTDTPLTEEGIAQCHAAGKQLQTARVDLIVASPITRALQSAQIIAGELGIDPDTIITNELFVERSFGPLEGTPYVANANLDATHGVEHSSDLIARVETGLRAVEGLPAKTIVIVAHGAVGRALRHLTNPDIPYHGSKKIDNAEVVQLS